MKEEFAEGVSNKCNGNEDWCSLKRELLDIASEICGCTKGKPRHFETWWSNKGVDVAVCRKRELFRMWIQSQNEEDRKKYCEAKKDAEGVVYMAMDQKAKQRVGEKKNVVVVTCLKDESGAVKVSVDDRKKIWNEHMVKLMNVENEWNDSIDAIKIEGAVRRIEVENACCVRFLNCCKNNFYAISKYIQYI